MTFSFFLPPAQPVGGRATMTAASTSRGERITVLDATFAEEQLRSGSFTGTTLVSGLDDSCIEQIWRSMLAEQVWWIIDGSRRSHRVC